MPTNVINLKLVGFKELEERLVGLGPKVAKRLLASAINSAAKPILEGARAGLTVRFGWLKRSLGVKLKTYKRTDSSTAVAVIGPRRGFRQIINGKPIDPANYAHLVEYGTAPHLIKPRLGTIKIGPAFIRGAVHHPGAKKLPFLRPAFDTRKNESLEILKQKLGKGIEREAAKR